MSDFDECLRLAMFSGQPQQVMRLLHTSVGARTVKPKALLDAWALMHEHPHSFPDPIVYRRFWATAHTVLHKMEARQFAAHYDQFCSLFANAPVGSLPIQILLAYKQFLRFAWAQPQQHAMALALWNGFLQKDVFVHALTPNAAGFVNGHDWVAQMLFTTMPPVLLAETENTLRKHLRQSLYDTFGAHNVVHSVFAALTHGGAEGLGNISNRIDFVAHILNELPDTVVLHSGQWPKEALLDKRISAWRVEAHARLEAAALHAQVGADMSSRASRSRIM